MIKCSCTYTGRQGSSPTGNKDIYVLVDSCAKCGNHRPVHPGKLTYAEADWIKRWNRRCEVDYAKEMEERMDAEEKREITSIVGKHCGDAVSLANTIRELRLDLLDMTNKRDDYKQQYSRHLDDVALMIKEHDATREKLEERIHSTTLHIREKIWVDMTPDSCLAHRILNAYIDNSFDTDNLNGEDPKNWVCIEMNKARKERNIILRDKIAKLR